MYTTLQLIRNCLCRYHMAYANRLNKYLQCRHYNEIHKPEKSEKFSNELKILCRIENLTKKIQERDKTTFYLFYYRSVGVNLPDKICANFRLFFRRVTLILTPFLSVPSPLCLNQFISFLSAVMTSHVECLTVC
jgi:hypothetical protein